VTRAQLTKTRAVFPAEQFFGHLSKSRGYAESVMQMRMFGDDLAMRTKRSPKTCIARSNNLVSRERTIAKAEAIVESRMLWQAAAFQAGLIWKLDVVSRQFRIRSGRTNAEGLIEDHGKSLVGVFVTNSVN
jgi:hypothetical protein